MGKGKGKHRGLVGKSRFRQLVIDLDANDWTPEQMVAQWQNLTLEQVTDILAWAEENGLRRSTPAAATIA